MDNYKITSIGRPLDKYYKTNKVFGIISMLVVILGFIYKLTIGSNVVDALFWSLGATFSVF